MKYLIVRGRWTSFCGAWLLLLLLNYVAYGQQPADKLKDHPRILLLAGGETKIHALVNENAAWMNLHQSILEACDSMLTIKPVERTLIGRRLLQVSREALRRIFYLSYAWRMTGDEKYIKRGEQELLAVSQFSDWNPTHFLDVAEMTTAVAIGYDWMYNKLPTSSKLLIKNAIREKGITPALDEEKCWWLRATNNWNQVCNGGITLGALAIMEDEPALAQKLVDRAVKSVQSSMAEYAPDGAYNEGYSYWGYGTSYNVLLISALEAAFDTDFALSQQPGFLQTAQFYANLIGPSGLPFSYGDCGVIEGVQPAMYWFAGKLNDPSLLAIEKRYLLAPKFNVKTNRLLPAALLWANGLKPEMIGDSVKTLWYGKGKNEVAMLRSSANSGEGLYVGLKAGTPGLSHGHMDIGSFVMDAKGVRWSMDFGMQQYNSLESAGLDIWNMEQNSQRWDVFRYVNFSHSTLTVNGHKQDVKGSAQIIRTAERPSGALAVMEMTSVYKRDLRAAKRGIALVNNQFVQVRDEVESGDSSVIIQWKMLTPARVKNLSKDQMVLSSQDQELTLYVRGAPEARLKTWPTTPPHAYDVPNPGTQLVGFELELPPHTTKSIDVLLVPKGDKVPDEFTVLGRLEAW
ncbi:heparinase II/III domain-containing protein [Olivibacter domesticus]|uniref:Heparinase II/III-like protein n=1 Tax=Olivibacter domesticus TaxID=407022 RepID=A0A1H7H0T5_OLID1|nr:heparinase II/III family protein [Olivibacter domesticus]SEK43357.1 Heparinase II/III-like protein [Olivibacter domesticus]